MGLPELDRDRVRRRVERQGDRLMRQRLACRRHEQLKELVELLPPAPPQLSRAARRAKEKKLREEAERAREEAERLYREARRGYALRRFRAAGAGRHRCDRASREASRCCGSCGWATTTSSRG